MIDELVEKNTIVLEAKRKRQSPKTNMQRMEEIFPIEFDDDGKQLTGEITKRDVTEVLQMQYKPRWGNTKYRDLHVEEHFEVLIHGKRPNMTLKLVQGKRTVIEHKPKEVDKDKLYTHQRTMQWCRHNFSQKFIQVVKAIQANPKTRKDWLDVPVGCPLTKKPRTTSW